MHTTLNRPQIPDNPTELSATPFTDALLSLREKHTMTYHALPLSHCQSISRSVLYEKFLEVFGPNFLKSEVTYSGAVMDSPAMAQSVLDESQEITAKAFGAASSLYVTMGTTMANMIAVHSAVRRGERVLADRTCHQSMHFTLQRLNCQVDYCVFNCLSEQSERHALDINDLIGKYAQAYESGNPYRLVILNSLSYEGVFYDIGHIMEQCIRINDDVSFLVDEAWSAFFYFHPWYRKFSAMWAARAMRNKHPTARFAVICTQSVHKSLSGIRQSSLIHINGAPEGIERLKKVKYSLHTTSPSYPILCSLEMARAQAVIEGEELIERSLRSAAFFKKDILTDPMNQHASINDLQFSSEYEHIFLDPLKISVQIRNSLVSPAALKEKLMLDYGIYVNRITESSVLFNVQLGISTNEIEHLLKALKTCLCRSQPFSSRQVERPLFRHEDFSFKPDSYVIPYPPGVPLHLPDETATLASMDKINRCRRAGVNIIQIDKDSM